ncbi:putative glutathione S-transferase GSTU6, partial [Dichanthelium oligosanthes]
ENDIAQTLAYIHSPLAEADQEHSKGTRKKELNIYFVHKAERMAGGDELKLLGTWASPFVIRVKLALSFKGLSYENLEEEDLYYNKSELLLKSNPVHKKVPVLIHNGKPVCESQLIVQYIDEALSTEGPSLLPAEPYKRAMARFWAAYIDDKLFASAYQAGRAKTDEEKAEALKQTFEAVETLEAAFKECSKGKPFFGGDSVGYLDIVLGGLIPVVYVGAARYGIKLFDGTRSPLLEAWMERFGALDAAKAILPDEMAGDGELKLLGFWASPFVTRAKLALQIKGLSYEYIEEVIGNKSELLLSSNPVHKLVPVLIHNGKPVCESSVVVQYIDEAFAGTGPSLLPADPYERAVARFWAAYLDDKLVKPWRQVFMVKTDEERAEAMRQTVAAVNVLEGGLKECSGGRGPFFGGDSVGYMDVLLGGSVSWVKAAEPLSGAKLIDAAKTPLLAAWMERFCELDVAKAVLQDVDAVVEYARAVQARFTAAITPNN